MGLQRVGHDLVTEQQDNIDSEKKKQKTSLLFPVLNMIGTLGTCNYKAKSLRQNKDNKIYKTKNIYTTQCSPLCEEVLRSFTFFHVLLLCSFHLFKLNIIYFYNYAKAINAV